GARNPHRPGPLPIPQPDAGSFRRCSGSGAGAGSRDRRCRGHWARDSDHAGSRAGRFMTAEEQLAWLTRNTVRVYTADDLRARLESGRALRVKLGVDPTAPDIHFGHTVVLSKLREFQDLGHQAVLIIGDFTARIGDPSGRSATRPQLSGEEISANAATYLEQVFKVLDQDRLEIRYNGEWLARFLFEDVVRLAAQPTGAPG